MLLAHPATGRLAVALAVATTVCAAQVAICAPDDARCLALTVYWEARDGARDAMVAVAWVVLNRQRSAKFPSAICAIVRQGGETPPCQFSYWCDGQPDVPRNAPAWKLARSVAREMLAHPPPDPTGGARFFHTAGTPAPWTVAHERTVDIGGLVFYR